MATVLLSLGGLSALSMGCTRTIEETAYLTLMLGDSKPLVLAKLAASPSFGTLQPAISRSPVTPSIPEGSSLVQLAAAELRDGEFPRAETEYLQEYDAWYFEEADGGRSVLIEFSDGAVSRVESRRTVPWWAGWL